MSIFPTGLIAFYPGSVEDPAAKGSSESREGSMDQCRHHPDCKARAAIVSAASSPSSTLTPGSIVSNVELSRNSSLRSMMRHQSSLDSDSMEESDLDSVSLSSDDEEDFNEADERYGVGKRDSGAGKSSISKPLSFCECPQYPSVQDHASRGRTYKDAVNPFSGPFLDSVEDYKFVSADIDPELFRYLLSTLQNIIDDAMRTASTPTRLVDTPLGSSASVKTQNVELELPVADNEAEHSDAGQLHQPLEQQNLKQDQQDEPRQSQQNKKQPDSPRQSRSSQRRQQSGNAPQSGFWKTLYHLGDLVGILPASGKRASQSLETPPPTPIAVPPVHTGITNPTGLPKPDMIDDLPKRSNSSTSLSQSSTATALPPSGNVAEEGLFSVGGRPKLDSILVLREEVEFFVVESLPVEEAAAVEIVPVGRREDLVDEIEARPLPLTPSPTPPPRLIKDGFLEVRSDPLSPHSEFARATLAGNVTEPEKCAQRPAQKAGLRWLSGVFSKVTKLVRGRFGKEKTVGVSSGLLDDEGGGLVSTNLNSDAGNDKRGSNEIENGVLEASLRSMKVSAEMTVPSDFMQPKPLPPTPPSRSPSLTADDPALLRRMKLRSQCLRHILSRNIVAEPYGATALRALSGGSQADSSFLATFLAIEENDGVDGDELGRPPVPGNRVPRTRTESGETLALASPMLKRTLTSSTSVSSDSTASTSSSFSSNSSSSSFSSPLNRLKAPHPPLLHSHLVEALQLFSELDPLGTEWGFRGVDAVAQKVVSVVVVPAKTTSVATTVHDVTLDLDGEQMGSLPVPGVVTQVRDETVGSGVTVPGLVQHMAKRMPVRKCWWEVVEGGVDGLGGFCVGGGRDGSVKVWVRRVWLAEFVAF
ncbi:hypothetical protein HDU67_001241 [Dinochytrium kinnereticum]|nr:hypothetical protein HDU67_001241 [Dinochytrium kinnereticum]